MGLLVMILGLVLFLGAHTFTTQREARARAIKSMGEGRYKGAYALVSAVGLALIVWGFAHYRASEWVQLWYPPKALKHLNVLLMLPAVILVVAAYIRGRIYVTLKHPMLAGVKLWAFGHLLANGDLGGISNDLIAVAVGVVAYLALAFAFHPVVIGVPVMGS